MLEYIGANVAKRLHAGHMRNLNLPHPKKLDIAVPANLWRIQRLQTIGV